MLFLQGSKLYDPEPVRARLDGHEQKKVLGLELAVLLGKVCPSRFTCYHRTPLCADALSSLWLC